MIRTYRQRFCGVVIALALAACSSGSDESSGASQSAATVAAATTPVATEAPVATDPPTTPAPTDPPVTEPPATEPPTTDAPVEPLQILVTNDDGYTGVGMAELVDGLLTLENVVVTVVAPAADQSGSGGKTTPGALVATDVQTVNGYPAKAVAGFPADSVIWALEQGGIDFVPDLVISGINKGQNFGPFVDLSGTVGAARAAATRNIPAVAISAGFGTETVPENYSDSVESILEWLTANIDTIAAHGVGEPVPEVLSINVPTCTNGGEVRGTQQQPLATEIGAIDFIADMDCNSALTDFTNDVDAFMNGFITYSPTPLQPTAPAP